MANTYLSLHYHVIFSTKNRAGLIHREIEERVWAYLCGIARANKFKAECIGGVENHAHALLELPAALAVSKAVQLLKGGSSAWIKDAFPEIPGIRQFAWQDGYAAFTVSKSQLPAIKRYIESQREHHRVKTFEEEYRAFLKKNEISFEESYLYG
jgi:REP element-mobilizing transposase RayT